jgi:hypothetical protein
VSPQTTAAAAAAGKSAMAEAISSDAINMPVAFVIIFSPFKNVMGKEIFSDIRY